MTEFFGNTTIAVVLTSLMMSGSLLWLLLRIVPRGQESKIRISQMAFERKRKRS